MTAADQLELEIGVYVAPTGASVQERFEAFHANNPWVYRSLVALARDMKARGHGRVGMKMLFEVLRWQYARRARSDDFALNNNYTSRYARMIAAREADIAHMFEFRELKAA